jgi:predicted Fe-Mo cluster-binding NifX family protein
MGNKMKIAIPTDDGLIIRQQFRGSRGFIVATILEGKIHRQELRWNLLSEILTSEHGYFYNLIDCDVVIVNEIGPRHHELLLARKKKITLTNQTEIPKALNDYVSGNLNIAEVKQVA